MKIMIISEYIAPVNAVAAIRWTKLGKYLSKEHNCTIDILTNQKSFDNATITLSSYTYDTTLKNDISTFNKIYEITEPIKSRAINSVFNLLQYIKHYKLKTTNSNNRISDGASYKKEDGPIIRNIWDLYIKAKDYPRISKALSMKIDWDNYDIVISSYGPKWVHLVGKKIKKQHPQIIWIADYRDELVFSDHSNTKENREFPAKHTHLADCITFVSNKFENLMLPEGQKRFELHNGYDKEDMSNRKRTASDKFYISITGTLYNDGTNHSDLKPLFLAISELVYENKIDTNNIEILYCGKSDSIFIQQIYEFQGIPWKNFGLLPRQDALSIQDSSSILTLPIWNTTSNQGVLSGRIYEYLSSGVPVLGLCSGDVPNSLLKEMIETANTGFCYEEACKQKHFTQLKEFILKKYKEWETVGLSTCNSNWNYIQTFEYSYMAKEFFEMLNSIKENR